MKKTIASSVLLLPFLFGGLAQLFAGPPGTVTVKGSTTLLPVGRLWAEAYVATHKGTVVEVSGGGSSAGVAALIDGTTDICAASRPMTDQEKEQVRVRRGRNAVETWVALDAVAVFIHNSNPIDKLSLAQLAGIYSGRIRDWAELGAPSGKIVCYGREAASGTRASFKEHVLGSQEFAADINVLEGSDVIVSAVRANKLAIGYGAIEFNAGVRAISIGTGPSAIPPTVGNVETRTYPLSRKLFYYTAGEPTGDVKGYMDWVRGSGGQVLCVKAGLVPLPEL